MRKALMLAAASTLVLSACGRSDADHAPDPAPDRATDTAIVEPEPVPARPAATDRHSFVPAQPAPPAPRLQVRPSQRLEAVAPAEAAVAPSVPAQAAPRRIAPPPALAPAASIAYAFSYVLSAQKDRGAELMSRHEYACVSAGPGLCQVISANADWASRRAGGKLEMRGQPEWINRFRSELAADARNAGGRLETAVTQGEDVTRGIDVARTDSATTATIAERIRELQRRSGGTLDQRLDIERQIADLQRQYDAQQIELRALNDRVLSARLTIDYREGGAMAADSPTRPVLSALENAFGLAMGMLAVLITAGSVLLPVAAIGGVIWWVVRRRRKLPVAA